MRFLSVLLSLLILLSLSVWPARAQDAGAISCQLCGELNIEKNNYCTSCGARLMAQKQEERETALPAYHQPPRLFSLPTAAVLQDSYLGFTFGNDFGMQAGESILGTVSLGVGEIGEIELSTAGLVTSVVSNRTAFRTAGMKIQLFTGNGVLPAMGVSLRSSNEWERENRNEQEVASSDPGAYEIGLRSLNLESRLTTLSLFVSKQIREQLFVHAGIGFSDIRYRNVYSWFTSGSVYNPSERRTNQWQGFAGASLVVNNRTTLMGEVQTSPLFKYDVHRGTVRVSRMYVGAAGLRFSLTPGWSVDGALRYQDNFVGLADVQFRLSLNALVLLN